MRQLPGGGPVRAVVVDETELMHFAIRVLLSAAPGIRLVAAARSVGAGEQMVRRVRPDLVICDTDIGGESGIGLCRWVRQVAPATCVAILTGRDEPLLAQSALAAGAHGYLLKDSAPEDLVCYLEEAAAGLLVPAQRRRSGQESPGALRDSLAGLPVPERAGHGGQPRP